MASRPQGCKSIILAADGYVINKPGKNAYSLVVSFVGATAGDRIALRDGGPTGESMVIVAIGAVNGTLSIPLGRYGINFGTSIYYCEVATAAGKITTTIVYD